MAEIDAQNPVPPVGRSRLRVKSPRYLSFKQWSDPMPPFRNCSCPEYERCLSRAAVDNMLLDCRDCPHRDLDFF